jgi:hypothetical protein
MTTTMNRQLATLTGAEINFDLFYSVTFTNFGIKLQGPLTGETRKYCEKLGFEFSLTECNWLQAKNSRLYYENFEIILTF